MDSEETMFVAFLLAASSMLLLLFYHSGIEGVYRQRMERARRILMEVSHNHFSMEPIVKSGISCMLMMDMDPKTFQRHFRLTKAQFYDILDELWPVESDADNCQKKVSREQMLLMFLWYMANQNSFREMSDKFAVSQSTAHAIISTVLDKVCRLAPRYIKWQSPCEKQASAQAFSQLCGKDDVVGAIDGCHIRIQRPNTRHHGNYINRKGYYSVLLQGICDENGKFIDIFTGIPGCVHDARMLRMSDFFSIREEKLGGYHLLGDSAYISNQFNGFIYTPKRDNGTLTVRETRDNTDLSRGRVVIENAFGRLKCRFRRLREIQNVKLDVIVKVVIAGCVLHNFCLPQVMCEEHPHGCPRQGDQNETLAGADEI